MTAKKLTDPADKEASALAGDSPVERVDTGNSDDLHPAGLADPAKPPQLVPSDAPPHVAYTDNSEGMNPAGGRPEDDPTTAVCVDGPLKGQYQSHTGKKFTYTTHEGGDGPLTEAGHPVVESIEYRLKSRDGIPVWTCGQS